MKVIKRFIASLLLLPFSMTTVIPVALASEMPWMPQPGTMVTLTPAFMPSHLRGMVIHPNDPFKFDFLVYRGDQQLTNDQKQLEYSKLIKYFLAALAIPDEDQWVNLSPYEKDRIIPDNYGLTEMGRDVLAQDYMLKQVSSSLTNPDTELGKKFWDAVYEKAYDKLGTTDIPTDTFSKVWIVPDKAVIFEKGNSVVVLEHHLKVMLESDYRAMKENGDSAGSTAADNEAVKISKDVMREIIIPAIQKEVNEGKNFAPLRQIHNSMLLAAWYKRALKESILTRVYGDQAKVKGVDQDPKANQEIFNQYLAAFKKGVFNMIKEDVDRFSQEVVPRKYFSGGNHSMGYALAHAQVTLQRAPDSRQTQDAAGEVEASSDLVTAKMSLFSTNQKNQVHVNLQWLEVLVLKKNEAIGRRNASYAASNVPETRNYRDKELNMEAINFFKASWALFDRNDLRKLLEFFRQASQSGDRITSFGLKKFFLDIMLTAGSMGDLLSKLEELEKVKNRSYEEYSQEYKSYFGTMLVVLEAVHSDSSAVGSPATTGASDFLGMIEKVVIPTEQERAVAEEFLREPSNRNALAEELFRKVTADFQKEKNGRKKVKEHSKQSNVSASVFFGIIDNIAALIWSRPFFRQHQFELLVSPVVGNGFEYTEVRSMGVVIGNVRIIKNGTNGVGFASKVLSWFYRWIGQTDTKVQEETVLTAEMVKDIVNRIYVYETAVGSDELEVKDIPLDDNTTKFQDQNLRGGIDFAQSNLDMQIKRDGAGIPLPISLQNLDNIRIDGLVPVILEIKPAVGALNLTQ